MDRRSEGLSLITAGLRSALRVSLTLTKSGLYAAEWAERQAMDLLQTRSERNTPAVLPSSDGALDQRMRALLQQAVVQSSTDSRRLLFKRLLDQLTPDEARIVGALSDGSSAPVVDIQARTRPGRPTHAELQFASSVGRSANVALPHLTPTYVKHLLSLGLVELRPEDPDLKDEFEILLADANVLAALKAGALGRLPARVERRTLVLSHLGSELWRTCFPDSGNAP